MEGQTGDLSEFRMFDIEEKITEARFELQRVARRQGEHVARGVHVRCQHVLRRLRNDELRVDARLDVPSS